MNDNNNLLGERLFKPLLLKGGNFLKYGRSSRPLKRRIRVTNDLKYIIWYKIDENKNITSLKKNSVVSTISMIAGDDNNSSDDDIPVITTPVKNTLGLIIGDENAFKSPEPPEKLSNKSLLVTSLQNVVKGFIKTPFLLNKTNFNENCAFTLVFKKRNLRLLAETSKQREFWMRAFDWLRGFTTSISTPFNVVHRLSVDEQLEWKVPNSDDNEVDNSMNFELNELLGYGTYGRVHHATHKLTGYELAVKLVFVDDEMNSDEMKQEINILKQCRHPNIVSCFGSWGPDERHQLWILMELCTNGSIIDLLKRNSNINLTEQQICYILLYTLKALEYLHVNRSIVHRDIKGRNILITEDGEVKLTDFGHSMMKNDEDQLLNPLSAGTPYWMAPEVINGSSNLLFASDIWSIGITALELANSGEPPRSEIPPFDVLDIIVNEPPPILIDNNDEFDRIWSDEFHDFIKICLQKDPKQRPTVTNLLKHPLFELHHNLSSTILQSLCTGDLSISSIVMNDDNSATFYSDGGLKLNFSDDDNSFYNNRTRTVSTIGEREWPSLKVIVSDPIAVNPPLKVKYILYKITTIVSPDDCDPLSLRHYNSSNDVPSLVLQQQQLDITPLINSPFSGKTSRTFQVQRRFNDFKFLHHVLIAQFPGYLMPNLPPSEYFGRFKTEFVQHRMNSLNYFLEYLTQHPILCRSRSLVSFLFRDPTSWNCYMQENPVKTPHKKLSSFLPNSFKKQSDEPISGILKVTERLLNLNRKHAQIYRSLNAAGKLIKSIPLCLGLDKDAELQDHLTNYMDHELYIPLDALKRYLKGLNNCCKTYRNNLRHEFEIICNKFDKKNQEWQKLRDQRNSKNNNSNNSSSPLSKSVESKSNSTTILHEDVSPIKNLKIPDEPLPTPNIKYVTPTNCDDIEEKLVAQELRLSTECMDIQNLMNDASSKYRDAQRLYDFEYNLYKQTQRKQFKTILKTLVNAQIENAKRQQNLWQKQIDNINDEIPPIYYDEMIHIMKK